jgi:peptidoglycan/LPS O-acetylase OafA/YrhL
MDVQRYYKPELDVLRLFAFLFVFFVHRLDLAPIDSHEYYWAFHLSLLGNYGVPLFFFLSAFLITELLIREQDIFGQINIKSFYLRRILRIWPLYFTFFYIMVFLTSTTTVFGSPIPAETQIAFTFFSGNWNITFNQWQSYCINPLWSVSVEEQLYIILPLIVFYAGRRGLKIFSYLTIAISYLTITYYALHPTPGFSGKWTNSFVQFQFFAAGILCSVYLNGKQPQSNIFTRLLMFILGVGCWMIASIVCEINADAPHLATIGQSVSGWILILIGVMLVFFSLLGISSKYLPNPLIYLGRISFGMYMVHITIYWIIYRIFKDELVLVSDKMGLANWKNELGLVLAFMITVSFATLSYHFFEKPFLKLKNRFTLVPSREL